MNSFTIFAAFLLAAAVQAQCPTYELKTVTHASRGREGFITTVRRFRTEIGPRNNGDQIGSQRTGYREISFQRLTVPFEMPANFFNRGDNVRGITFDTETGVFLVSTPPDGTDFNFNSILPQSLTDGFRPFTRPNPMGDPPRLFSPLFTNTFSAKFRIPGSNRLAATAAFGILLLDVDQADETYVEFFDRNDCLIQRLLVPALNNGISFAGLIVKQGENLLPAIYSVRVKQGTSSIDEFSREYTNSDTPNRIEQRLDVVVTDLLLFAEPQ